MSPVARQYRDRARRNGWSVGELVKGFDVTIRLVTWELSNRFVFGRHFGRLMPRSIHWTS
jgi:hypothetical protein